MVAYPVGGLEEIVLRGGVAGLTEAAVFGTEVAVFGGDRTGLGAGPTQASMVAYDSLGREAVEAIQFSEEAGGEASVSSAEPDGAYRGGA